MRVVALAMIASLFMLTGCMRVLSPRPTSMSYDSSTMEILGLVSGEAGDWYVLGIPFGWESDFSSELAVRRALEKVNGHLILNPTFDTETGTVLGFFTWHTIRVHGTAARYRVSGLNFDGTLKLNRIPR